MEPHLDVLHVDDDDGDVALFARAVAKSGRNIRVQALSAGQSAIDYLQAKGVYANRSLHPLPDVIVLDLAMPQVNGFDFLAWRKVSSFFSSIPVVVLSGPQHPNEAQRVMALGANKHLIKPTDFEDWKKVVGEIWDLGTKGTRAGEEQSKGTL